MRLLETASHAALRPLEHRLSFRNGEAKLDLVDGRYMLQVRGAGGARRIVDTRSLGDGPLVVDLQPEATLQVDSSATPTPTRLVLTAEDGAPAEVLTLPAKQVLLDTLEAEEVGEGQVGVFA
jgi:hypothetical protein